MMLRGIATLFLLCIIVLHALQQAPAAIAIPVYTARSEQIKNQIKTADQNSDQNFGKEHRNEDAKEIGLTEQNLSAMWPAI